jgi:GTP-binding protein
MAIPSVVIVGRANVGKSSLFNAIYGQRVSIVEPTPGVTRDRISRVVERDGLTFELWDTGGMGLQDSVELAADIEQQIRFAIQKADLVLFVLDAKAGVQPLDESIARDLRQMGKRVLAVVNKCDTLTDEAAAADFYRLGFDDLYLVSAAHRRGTGDLVDRIISVMSPSADVRADREPAAPEPQEAAAGPMKIAFVGRRNVGKSTLVNYLAREPRVIVSEVPGTTRDSVDVCFQIGNLEFVAIDTAGLRRRKQVKDSIDFYSIARAEGSIQRADVVVHLMDAPGEVSRLDKQIADHVTASYKPCILAVSKTDLAPQVSHEQFEEYLRDRLPGVAFAPIVCISGQTGQGVTHLIEVAQALHQQGLTRVPTADLNRVVQEAVTRRPPSSKTSRQPRIYYATQVSVKPPTVVLFTNEPQLIGENYQRYLANQLRQSLPYSSIPIRFRLRARKRPVAPGKEP